MCVDVCFRWVENKEYLSAVISKFRNSKEYMKIEEQSTHIDMFYVGENTYSIVKSFLHYLRSLYDFCRNQMWIPKFCEFTFDSWKYNRVDIKYLCAAGARKCKNQSSSSKLCQCEKTYTWYNMNLKANSTRLAGWYPTHFIFGYNAMMTFSNLQKSPFRNWFIVDTLGPLKSMW